MRTTILFCFLALVSCTEDNPIDWKSTSKWIPYDHEEVIEFQTPDGDFIMYTISYIAPGQLVMQSDQFTNIHMKTTDFGVSIGLERVEGEPQFDESWNENVKESNESDPLGLLPKFRTVNYCEKTYRVLDRSSYDGNQRFDLFMKADIGLVSVGEDILRGELEFHLCDN